LAQASYCRCRGGRRRVGDAERGRGAGVDAGTEEGSGRGPIVDNGMVYMVDGNSGGFGTGNTGDLIAWSLDG